MDKFTKTEQLIAQYRWEFLRRNKDYQEEFKSLPIKTPSRISDKFYFGDNNRTADQKLWEKWQILYYINPKYKFQDFVLKHEKESLFSSILYFIRPISENEIELMDRESRKFNLEFYGKEKALEYLKKDDEHFMNSVDRYEILVNLYSSKERIMEVFEERIDYLQGLLKKVLKRNKKRGFDTRNQIQQYDRYLRIFDEIGDCFNVGNKTKLARKYYKNHISSNDINYARRKIQRDYKASLKLIEGGYRQIR